MRFKVLFVPLAIAAAIYVSVFFIKPDYLAWQTKKQELSFKESQVASMDDVLANIASLEENATREKAKEDFLYLYLPRDYDQSRLIDAFNFLASQSGVALSSIALAKVEKEATQEESLLGTSGALTSVNPGLGVPADPAAIPGAAPGVPFPGDPGMMPAGPGMMPGSDPTLLGDPTMLGMVPGVGAAAVEPDTVTADLTIEGTYGNIKGFLERVAAMNRINSLGSVALAERSSDGEEGAAPASDPLLTAKVSASLDYLRVAKVSSALSMATFRKPEYNWQPLDAVMSRVNTLPALESVGGGKNNPFGQ